MTCSLTKDDRQTLTGGHYDTSKHHCDNDEHPEPSIGTELQGERYHNDQLQA